MLKKLSIRCKITLWFSTALIIIATLTYFIVLAVSNNVLQKTIRDNLIEAVENNIDEIEYFSTIDDIIMTDDVDYYLNFNTGFLEIDDDFLDEVNQVYTSLYHEDGTMLYGENPIAKEVRNLNFTDLKIQELKADGTLYYVFDRKLTLEGLDGLWLRGVVSELQGTIQIASITQTSLFLLPVLVLITIIGGYLSAGRMLRPIRQISNSAALINKGHDLRKRIDIGEGKDELHRLVDSFNDMFERLDKAFEAEQRFTSDVSHELRTPMTVIMTQCELALEQDCDAEYYREALTVIGRQGGKMTRLINDMLTFTRLELKTERYIKEQLDFSELVTSICHDMALICENNIQLKYDVEPSLYCHGNHDLLMRLLTNLISNAYRYGRENGFICVCLKAEDGMLYLSVKDNGIGISEADRELIFNRFYQADSSRSGFGTGLGLSIVREIAHMHGGEISVESDYGKGSTFIFSILQN